MLTREENGVATFQQVYQPWKSKDCEEEEVCADTNAISRPVRSRAGPLPLSAPQTEQKCSLLQRKDETWFLVVTPDLSTCVMSSLV